jgi:hypothetical protein
MFLWVEGLKDNHINGLTPSGRWAWIAWIYELHPTTAGRWMQDPTSMQTKADQLDM